MFLKKYQLSVVSVYFLLRKKVLIGQSAKIFSVKTGFEEFKKTLKKSLKNIRKSRNFGGLDATNELKILLRKSQPDSPFF